MKRATLLMIPFLLLVVLVAAVAAEIPRLEEVPTDVQARLEQYIAYTFPHKTVTIQAVQRAERPWNFGPGMSTNDSVHFQTDTGPTRTLGANLAALYYPPQDIWCVQLEIAGTGQTSYDAVFVGVHIDLYNAGLVVHQAAQAPWTPEYVANLADIGCDLPLPELAYP